MHTDIVKIILPSILAFTVGIMGTPLLTHYLYKHKMWKKKSVQKATDGTTASITASLHRDEERKTPRMGGVVIWASSLLVLGFISLLASIFPETIFAKLSFFSRDQTWIPAFTLLAGALCGLVDDYLVCQDKGGYAGGGLELRVRLGFVGLLGLFSGYWFFAKLGMHEVYIPFWGALDVGMLIIPLVVMYVIGMYAGGIIDGVDGLAGGVFSAIFLALGIIAFMNGQNNIAAFCAAIVGGLLAFLWFNIPPARFYASETGTMALTTTMATVAFLTKSEVATLIIGLPLIVTAASSAIQIFSRRVFKRKVFVVAPLHNHFQAIGWPAYKVTMRYWVISMMLAFVGVVIQLTGFSA